jgi:hypothetical protein
MIISIDLPVDLEESQTCDAAVAAFWDINVMHLA